MFPPRDEILARFKTPVFAPHPLFPGMETFARLCDWAGRNAVAVELPRLKIEIHSIDYLRNLTMPAGGGAALRFQQDSYRVWYQVEGQGILQNATRNSFGAARPGLLGIMEPGERHTYLHQRGPFECFLMEFSLLPSPQAKCYWNSGVEGKVTLEDDHRLYFENLVFDLLRVITGGREIFDLPSISRILEIIVVLFSKGLLVVGDSQFPENKPKSLVDKAKQFMKLHYGEITRQEALERQCGVDINYLNILFAKETGVTLYKYLTGIRMEHAKHLLEAEKVPIVDIATSVGYPNSNSFARAFRRHTRQSPSAWRDKNKGGPAPRPA